MRAVDLAAGLTEREVVAATLWGEGRSLPVQGRVAIGCVIRNRMIRRQQSARQVCVARLQFSCWWKVGGAANHAALVTLLAQLPTRSDPLFLESLWIADGILSGACLDTTDGADHYLTLALLHSAKCPSWVAAMQWTVDVWGHAFFRS